MVKLPKKFLIDANTLMAAARLYYAYDLLPSFMVGTGLSGNLYKSMQGQTKEGKLI